MDAAFTLPGSLQIACKQNKSVYKSNRPAWGILTWPKVGEFNLANGAIEQAIAENAIQKYHFTLLRNLYKKTASFLGYPKWSDLLDSMPGDKQGYLNRIIQFSSHRTLSNEEVAEPTQPEKEMARRLLENLNKYGYWQKEEAHA